MHRNRKKRDIGNGITQPLCNEQCLNDVLAVDVAHVLPLAFMATTPTKYCTDKATEPSRRSSSM